MFQQLKDRITPLEVAYKYLGQADKKGFYKSPFRNEKTASFKVSNEKGFHDFGDSSHYDIISFTARYFNCSNKEACNILSKDFYVDIVENDYTKFLREQKEQEKKLKEYINNWFNEIEHEIFKIYKTWRNTYLSLKKTNHYYALIIIYKKLQYAEYLADYILSITTLDEKIELYKTKEELENYVRRECI